MLEPGEEELGAGRRDQEPLLDLVERGELGQLLLELAREATAAEIPALELLQEARGALNAELASRFSHEQDQLGRDLFA